MAKKKLDGPKKASEVKPSLEDPEGKKLAAKAAVASRARRRAVLKKAASGHGSPDLHTKLEDSARKLREEQAARMKKFREGK